MKRLYTQARRVLETAVTLRKPVVHDGTEMMLVPRCQCEALRRAVAEYEEIWFGQQQPVYRV